MNNDNVMSAISAVVDAASLSSRDKQRLMTFVQKGQENDDEDEPGVPKDAVYNRHSSDIGDVFKNLLKNAHAAHILALVKQSKRCESVGVANDAEA